MEICTSHFKEDLNWLKNSPWPVTVVDHEGASPHDFESAITIPNVGNEVTAYLKFIIDRYDNLPEFTAFLHGHEESYHQLAGRPILDLIRGANTEKYEYISLNNRWRFVTSQNHLGDFKDFLQKSGLISIIPQFYITDTCAQFIVSKRLILKNPKSFYQHIYNCIQKTTDAIAVEHCWGLIFRVTEKPTHDYFVPPLERIRYFPNLPFPHEEGPLIVLLNCKYSDNFPETGTRFEEHDGAFVVQFGGRNIQEGVMCKVDGVYNYTREDIYMLVQYLKHINDEWIKELKQIQE